MKETRIPMDYSHLDDFLNKTMDYVKTVVSPEVDPTCGIVRGESPGDVPVCGQETGWDVIGALKEEGNTVFFPFAYADHDGFLRRVDGNAYGPASHHEESEGTIMIGKADNVGYLVKVEGGRMVVNSAIHAGGGCPGPLPPVDYCKHRQFLDEPMVRFTGS